MAANQAEAPGAVVRFIRDWLLIAPIAILLALGISWVTGADLVTPQVQSGALIVYGLSIFVAFYEDLPTNKWRQKGRGWKTLYVTLTVLRLILIGLAIVGLVMVFFYNALNRGTTANLQLFMTAYGVSILVAGLFVGVGGLATRIAEGKY